MIPELETEPMWLPAAAARGPVVTVGDVNSNQIVPQDFSFSCTVFGPGGCPAFTI